MGKTIIIPEDYQPSNNQCGTLTQVSGSEYAGTNITVTQVKNAIGASSFAVGALVTSALKNIWAAFKPGSWNASGWMTAQYVWDNPSNNYKLGDYIGYNHAAKPPVYYYDTLPTTIDAEQWGAIVVGVRLARGEARPVAYPDADKTAVDIQWTWNSVLTHERVSVPAVGSTILKNITFTPNLSGNLDIKPFYYKDLGGSVYEDVAAIEDGFKSIYINIVPVKFTGTIEDLPDTTGGNPLLGQYLDWSLFRNDSTSRDIFARILITGSGIYTVSESLGYLSFTGNETKSGTVQVNIESSTGATTTVTIKLQISDSSSFTNTQDIAQSSFVWTNPGLPE